MVRQIGRWLVERDFDLILDARRAPPAVSAAADRSETPRLESDEAVEAAVTAEGGDGVTAIKAAVRHGWGVEVAAECSLPDLHLTPTERALAERYEGAGPRFSGPPLGISPVASISTKRWPVERFAAVADTLAEEGERCVWSLPATSWKPPIG